MKTLAFAAAMKDFFGLKEDQTLQGFMQELKALTTKDRSDFATMLATVGYDPVHLNGGQSR